MSWDEVQSCIWFWKSSDGVIISSVELKQREICPIGGNPVIKGVELTGKRPLWCWCWTVYSKRFVHPLPVLLVTVDFIGESLFVFCVHELFSWYVGVVYQNEIKKILHWFVFVYSKIRHWSPSLGLSCSLSGVYVVVIWQLSSDFD